MTDDEMQFYDDNPSAAVDALETLEWACKNLLDNAYEDYYPCVHEGDLDRIAVLIKYVKDWRKT